MIFFSAFFKQKILFNKKRMDIIPLSTRINFDNLYPVLLNRGI